MNEEDTQLECSSRKYSFTYCCSVLCFSTCLWWVNYKWKEDYQNFLLLNQLQQGSNRVASFFASYHSSSTYGTSQRKDLLYLCPQKVWVTASLRTVVRVVIWSNLAAKSFRALTAASGHLIYSLHSDNYPEWFSFHLI